jgi:UTP--glucose-1-phosphate uridylyltransferase
VNVVQGDVRPPEPGDVVPLPAVGSAQARAMVADGDRALAAGEVALVVLAGGMATRMGGLVKALVEALDGLTFLDVRLREMDAIERRLGRRPPLYLMTSAATDAAIRDRLGAAVDGTSLATFVQGSALRLTADGEVFLDDAGRPSEYAPGHGDLVDALRDSGLLGRFIERGGRQLMLANLDNLGATVDPLLVGWHRSHGRPLSCECVDAGSDRGGWPVRWNGRPVILEDFRLPEGFDRAAVDVFATNTFHVDASALDAYDAPWTWFRVEKTVDGRPAIQRERLLGELTSHLDTRFVHVPRSGSDSRFIPVKDLVQLEAARPALREVLGARGIL